MNKKLTPHWKWTVSAIKYMVCSTHLLMFYAPSLSRVDYREEDLCSESHFENCSWSLKELWVQLLSQAWSERHHPGLMSVWLLSFCLLSPGTEWRPSQEKDGRPDQLIQSYRLHNRQIWLSSGRNGWDLLNYEWCLSKGSHQQPELLLRDRLRSCSHAPCCLNFVAEIETHWTFLADRSDT